MMASLVLAFFLAPVVCALVVVLGIAFLQVVAIVAPDFSDWIIRRVFGLAAWAAAVVTR